MHMTYVAERELPLATARQRIDEQLAQLALNVEEHWEGTWVGSARIGLSSQTGATSQGCGKGLEQEARVGARFEALEHFLDEHLTRNAHLNEASDLARMPTLQDDMLQPWLAAQPHEKLACQAYHDLDGQWLFDYPLCLTRPDYADHPAAGETFDLRGLRRYSSNDGSAIGATLQEAILHALNQSIERDALSLFFLRHYYYRQPSPLRWVSKPGTHTELGRIWQHAEDCLEAPIGVLDISSEFASSTYLALRMSQASRLHGALFGAGASLDPWHAVRRAVTELVQVQLNSRPPGALDELKLAERLLRPFPRLQSCLQFDLDVLLEKAGHTVALPDPGPRCSVRQQLRYLYADLQRHGRQAGICQLFQGHEGISLVNVVVPGLERFHLVCSGNVVCPGPRGLAHRSQQP
ncbi:YcaO-like family protein [Pseudomonas sp. L7]|uniref:YcaO-like family protein n=1 Tax=unclassified Pseudomonas TaxID=196821 RepID=UPI0016444BC1|nr:YcaO-like family protein [Pseudomonas sp. RW3S2]MBC3423893.1 YcaO-like family protein [Pseudomonas sp. RW3S2]